MPLAPWRRPAHRAQAAGELAQEIMLVQLSAGLVLVEEGELELLHLLKVVVEDELLGERGVEVVDRGFRPVILAEGQGNRSRSQAAGSSLLGCPKPFCKLAEHRLVAGYLGDSQLTDEDTDAQRG